MRNPRIRHTVVLGGAVALLACGSDTPTAVPPSIVSVTITTPRPTLTAIGESITIGTVVGNSIGQSVADAPIAWTSSAPAIATVANGVVVAKANGSSLITASAGGHADTTTVVVFTARALAISPARPTLGAIGDSATLVAAASDAKGAPVNDVTTTWESSAPAVASVDKGVIVARSNGTTILTARVGSLVDTTTVTVQQRPAKLTFLTRPGSQLQAHVIAPVVEVEVVDSRGVRLAVPAGPVGISASVGALGGTTSRTAIDGVAHFDDLSPSEATRGTQLTAHLGDLSATSILFQVQLALASVSAGGVHTCGLTAAGVAYCWGYAERTGDGGTTSRTTPVLVSGTDRYRGLDAGSDRTFALGAAGGVVTWGSVPASFASTQAYSTITADWHSCGITAEQLAYCWGSFDSYFGAMPSGSNPTYFTTPTLAMGGMKVRAIAPGISYTCVIAAADSTAWCAGDATYGQTGSGTLAWADAPVMVAGGLKFISIDPGDEFVCGLTTTRETYCWGRNNEGQLGDPGETAAFSPLPRLVVGAPQFRTVSVGGAHACGLTDDGSAYCWGRNLYGTLGSSGLTAAWRAAVGPVSGGLKFDSLSAGGYHTCAIAKSGQTYCWGDWSNGATGTGSPNTNDGPALIAPPSP
jgi:alpha-tubulin suppressor-like RCC1 family protein